MPKKAGVKTYPKAIQRVVPERGQAYHIDPTTGQQTYPSWYKRFRPQLLRPEDLDRRPHTPTPDDRAVFHALTIQLKRNGEKLSEGIATDPIIAVLMELYDLKKFAAYERLYQLWCAGLVQREGVIDPRSNRPMHQRWYFGETE